MHAYENSSAKIGAGDEIITITSMSMPHLKAGALRDFERYVYPAFRQHIRQYNKSDHIFYFKNGAIIEFKSYEDEYNARGGRRTRLYINEANTFDWMVYFQLDSRTRVQSIIDYNPTINFWAHEKLIGAKGTQLYISDHRCNPFLTEEQHADIEGYKEKDLELWRVYARGLTGNIRGIIYPNWTCINDEDYPDEDGSFYGIDFGYENDPTALVQVLRIANNIYIKEIAYQKGAIPPRTIYQLLKANGYKDGQPVYCEHDEHQTRQLRTMGILSIPAKKGPNSVNPGIQKLKEYKIHYTHGSHNIKEELKKYIWLTDKHTGDPTNTPIDNWNHAMDAIRYAVYTHYYRKFE